MSLNHFTSNTNENKWANPYINTLKIKNGLDMTNSGLTNVASINGTPIPSPFSFDLNPVNIIYHPGGALDPVSNTVITWQAVIDKASRVNVSNIINIFFDDSKVSPCPIDVSHDFQGRATFQSLSNNLTPVEVKINDGTVIRNIKLITRSLNLNCEAITTSSLEFDNKATLELDESCTIRNMVATLVPVIVSDAKTLVIKMNNGCYLDNSLGNPAVVILSMINNSGTVYTNQYNTVASSALNNTISDDGTGNLIIYSDASWSSFPTFASYTGTYTQSVVDGSDLVRYDDSKTLPAWTTSSVQSALDHVKTSYLPISSSNSASVGDLTDTSLTASKIVETDGSKKLVSSAFLSTDFLLKAILWSDGSDGNVTLTGGTTIIARDMFYDTLTMNANAVINTNGYRIYAKTAITGDGTGIISMNGNNASGQTGGSGTSLTGLRFANFSGGVSGGNIGTNGNNGTSQVNGPGGNGGNGANSDTKTGGTGGTGNLFNVQVFKNLLYGASGFTTFSGGASGASGAGGSLDVGGGSGAGGGRVFISAKSFGNILSIQAKGGNGGDASGATGGVGGGGGGGFVYLQYSTLVSFVPGTQINVSGGANGTVGITTASTASTAGTYFLQQIS